MVDNLADKVNKCLLNVNYVLFVYNWEHHAKMSAIWSSGMSAV